MSTFNFTGAVSGLDTTSLISAMLQADKAPLTRIQTQQSTLTSQQTAYGDIRSLLSTLLSAAEAFSSKSVGASRAAASSNTTVLGATANTTAMAGTYAVVVDRLATSTRATSVASLGTPLTDADLATTLSNLALPGSITAGSVGMVVDGKVVRATIGTPGSTTLGDVLTAIGDALTSQVQANEGPGSTATVTASIVNNKLQLDLSGTTQPHSLLFGVGGDTSNALGVLGLTGMGAASLSSTTPVVGRTALGVVRTTTALDGAGLTGLSSGTGTLTINGAAIAYDSTKDSLSTLVTRINASAAGVVASLDRSNDKLILTARTGGAAPIAIEDTGTLAAALHLAPGTTDAQVLGQQAQITVDGTAYLSDTNKFSNAVAGVQFTALALGTSTVSVTPDETAIAAAANSLVNAYNALADKLDTLTANDPNGKTGALAGDSSVARLSLGLRRILTGVSGVAGSIRTMADIGISSGAVGAAKGATDRLIFNEDKFKAALEQDPTAVADLLDGAAGTVKPMADSIKAWTKVGGTLDKQLDSITRQMKDLDNRKVEIQDRIDAKQAALEAKFAAMEAVLAQLSSTTSSLSNTVAQQNKSG